MAIYHSLDFSNHAFRVYVTWGGFLLIKMLLMSFLTIFHRFRTGAVESPEDAAMNKKMVVKKDEAVERVRRAHLNDLENIPIFMLAALM
jgi:glutathione S-transferase